MVATVEAIQDEVERALMAAGAFAVARRYILYREARARRREEQALRLRDADGQEVLLNLALLRSWIAEACAGYEDRVSAKAIAEEVLAGLPAGAPLADLERSIVLAARTRIERDPAYSFVAARALLRGLYAEALGRRVGIDETRAAYPLAFAEYVRRGVELELLAPEMLDFDLERLGAALAPERDLAFQYLGLQTLYDRYLIHHGGGASSCRRCSGCGSPWAWRCKRRTARSGPSSSTTCISSFRFCPSTPTLFNAGTRYPQLSSCYLSTVSDDLGEIFKTVRDNALLSKWSGGIGNDWTPVRALGSHIKGTNGAEPGRRSLPQGRQRHRHRGQSGRQAQGRRLRLPRGLAPRRRGVPRPAQEHRRRPPPHPRHAHRALDPRPLHAAGGGRRRLDALQPERRPRPARSLRRGLRPRATPSTKPRSTGARSPTPNGCARSISGERC